MRPRWSMLPSLRFLGLGYTIELDGILAKSAKSSMVTNWMNQSPPSTNRSRIPKEILCNLVVLQASPRSQASRLRLR